MDDSSLEPVLLDSLAKKDQNDRRLSQGHFMVCRSTYRIRYLCLLTSGAMLFCAAAADAVTISLQIDLENSVFANPTVPDGPDRVFINLAIGDLVAVRTIVSNPTAEAIDAIFATVEYDATEFTFLGGSYASAILDQGFCTGFGCANPVLSQIQSSPGQQPLSPFALSTGVTGWIQAVAHTGGGDSTVGQGPDAASLLGFTATTTTFLDLRVVFDTDRDLVNGPSGPLQNIQTGSLIQPATEFSFPIYIAPVPEPTTALLLGLGLAGLSQANRRGRPLRRFTRSAS